MGQLLTEAAGEVGEYLSEVAILAATDPIILVGMGGASGRGRKEGDWMFVLGDVSKRQGERVTECIIYIV